MQYKTNLYYDNETKNFTFLASCEIKIHVENDCPIKETLLGYGTSQESALNNLVENMQTEIARLSKCNKILWVE